MPARRTSASGPGRAAGRSSAGATFRRVTGTDPARRRNDARREPARGDGGRSASRPAASRRPALGGRAQRTRAPRPRRFTGRAAVLALIVAALVLAYAYPVRTYLTQNAEVNRLKAQLSAQQTRIEGLSDRSRKWDDPAYVAQQARERLHMVRPGDTAIVIGDAPAAGTTDPFAPDRGRATGSGSWYAKLWSSTRAADQPRHE